MKFEDYNTNIVEITLNNRVYRYYKNYKALYRMYKGKWRRVFINVQGTPILNKEDLIYFITRHGREFLSLENLSYRGLLY